MRIAALTAGLRGLAVVAVTAVLTVASPALAQIDVPTPKVFMGTDRNGVDMVGGSLTMNLGTVSVGGPGGLSNSISVNQGTLDGPYYRHSLVGGINRAFNPGGTLQTFTVTYFGEAIVFNRNVSGSYTLREGRGGALSLSGGGYSYTAPDGSVAVYSTALKSWEDNAMANEASLVSVTRPSGEVLTYHYTVSGVDVRLQSVTNTYGYQIHFQYAGPSGPSVSKVEAINNAVDPCAPTANVCTLTQAWPTLTLVGNDWVDSLGRAQRSSPAGVIWPAGSAAPVITTGYIWDGDQTAVTSVSDGAGTWTYAYGPKPDPTWFDQTSINTITDPLGHVTQVKLQWGENRFYDPPRYEPTLISITNPLNQTTTYGFLRGTPTHVAYPEGDSETWQLNPDGNVIAYTHQPKPGSGLTATSVTVAYADTSTPIRARRPTSITDQRGYVTDFTYDAAGNRLTATSPAPTPGAVRPQVRATYAQQYAWYKQGGSSSITQAATPVWVQTETSACATLATCDGTADEVLTTTVYQAGSAGAASNLLPISISSGSGDGLLTATTTTTYNGAGDVLTVNGPLAGTADTTRQVWDVMRQQVGVIGPDPDGAGSRLYPATRTTYNADGQVTAGEQGTTLGQTDGDWSAFSPLQTATTAYDAQGRKVRDTAAAGTADAMVTQYSYDAASRLTCSARRMNPAVYGSLPASACVLGTTGANGPDRIAFNTYDDADRLLSTTNGYLSGTTITESQTWTTNGKVATRTDGNGNLSTYVYDGFDRVSRLRFPNASGGGSSTTDYEEYGYDAASNVTSFRNRAGEIVSSGYDALNRKTVMGGTAIADRTFTFDNLSRQTGGQFTGGGASYANTWDALGRMTSQTQSPLGTVSYQYDLAGRRTRVTWPDAFWVDYDWSLDNQLVAMREYGATSGPGGLAAFYYDNLGRRTAIGRGNTASTFYAYDAASRLTALTQDPSGTAQDVAFGFTFNPASQILSRTSSNAAYAFVPTVASAAYVNNGRNQVTSAGGVTITYDPRWNITATGSATYGFNGLNQMTTATVGGVATGLSYDPMDRLYQAGGTRFLYDGVQAIAEYDASGALTRRYAPGAGGDETIVAYGGATTTDRRWLLTDERGSVIAQTDVTGAVTAINTYDEYGRPASGNVGRFQYTGQMWLPEAGVYHYKARAYEPNLGRFLQTDPVGYEAGLNLYAYVHNDPVNGTDPSGTQARLEGRSGDELLRQRVEMGMQMSEGDAVLAGVAVGAMAGATTAVVLPESLPALVSGLRTPQSGRIFWSGGRAARDAAADLARSTGGVTLEQTAAGKGLQALTNGLARVMGRSAADRVTAPLWRMASRNFAEGATGDVTVVLRGTPREASIWRKVEEPILQGKNNINIYRVE